MHVLSMQAFQAFIKQFAMQKPAHVGILIRTAKSERDTQARPVTATKKQLCSGAASARHLNDTPVLSSACN